MAFGMVVNLNQGIRGDIAASKPGNIAKYARMRIQVAQGRPDFLSKNAAGAKRNIAINDRYLGS